MRLSATPLQSPLKPDQKRRVVSVMSTKRQYSVSFRCSALTEKEPLVMTKEKKNNVKTVVPVERRSSGSVAEKWMEYQGLTNWEGLLDPLDHNLRAEILRYGGFVEAAYQSFNFDPSSPSFGTCIHPKKTLFQRCGLPETGYRITKYLRATSGIQLPRWAEMGPTWMTSQSSWIGYVAVCHDKRQIAKLGRRDVVISLRGTATGLEWLENLRATLAPMGPPGSCGPMVETGFLSLYTSRNKKFPSLQDMIRQEIARLLQTYGDEPLSLTITGHSLGAALATLAAHDIKTTFPDAPMVTVISFGGPRVGNRSLRSQLEKQGTKVLRIVNPDDVITRVPGFLIDNNENDDSTQSSGSSKSGVSGWIGRRVEDTQLGYAEVGRELRLSTKDSPRFGGINVARSHELKTYLNLVSTSPFGATPAKKMFGSKKIAVGR